MTWLDVPILGHTGGCLPAIRRLDGLGMLLMSFSSLAFDLIATTLVIVLCTRSLHAKRSLQMHRHGGNDVLSMIWREAVFYWLAVAVLHLVNMYAIAHSL